MNPRDPRKRTATSHTTGPAPKRQCLDTFSPTPIFIKYPKAIPTKPIAPVVKRENISVPMPVLTIEKLRKDNEFLGFHNHRLRTERNKARDDIQFYNNQIKQLQIKCKELEERSAKQMSDITKERVDFERKSKAMNEYFRKYNEIKKCFVESEHMRQELKKEKNKLSQDLEVQQNLNKSFVGRIVEEKNKFLNFCKELFERYGIESESKCERLESENKQLIQLCYRLETNWKAMDEQIRKRSTTDANNRYTKVNSLRHSVEYRKQDNQIGLIYSDVVKRMHRIYANNINLMIDNIICTEIKGKNKNESEFVVQNNRQEYRLYLIEESTGRTEPKISDTKEAPCPLCSFKATSAAFLVLHLKNKHIGSK